MFSTAKTLAAKPTAAKKAAKTEIEIGGIFDLARLNALIVAATAIKSTIEAQVKAAGRQEFMDMAGSTRPNSFSGVDGLASASVEMRKRSTMSALNADEIALLAEYDIAAFEQVTTQQLFAINPTYAQDQAMLGKVEKALGKLGLPEDFIVQQAGSSKFVVTDEMLDKGFKTKNAAPAIEVMTVMALKTKLSAEYDMDKLIEDAVSIMQPKKAKVSKLPVAKAA